MHKLILAAATAALLSGGHAMPFDVPATNAAASGPLPELGRLPTLREHQERPKFLRANLLKHPSVTLLASSARGDGPARNVLDEDLARPWRTLGCFVISDETDRGYQWAPNWRLWIEKPPGSNLTSLDMRDPPGVTTKYRDPRVLAGLATARLRASGLPGASGFLVEYDDKRQAVHFDPDNPKEPTYKWRIRHTGGETFKIFRTGGGFADTIIWPTWGFILQTTYEGSDLIGDVPSCHTEEDLILGPLEIPMEAGAGLVHGWSWLAAALPLWGELLPAEPFGPKVTVYLATSQAGLIDKPDSDFEEGVDLFQLGTRYGAWEGRESQLGHFHHPGEPALTRYHIAYLGGWRSENPVAPFAGTGVGYVGTDGAYVRLKIIDPAAVLGHVGIGHLFIGPAWFPSVPPSRAWTRGVRDRVEIFQRRFGGSLAMGRPPSRTIAMGFKYLSRGDAEFLEASVAPHPPFGGGIDRPVFVVDPMHQAPIGSVTEPGDGDPTYLARGTLFGRVKLGLLEEGLAHRRLAMRRLEVVEESIGVVLA